jgi:hypothetical protein
MLHAQQVVFSHRVYRAQGRSYQQLWMWSADAGTLRQISHGERDHLFPNCEADGRHVIFEDWAPSDKGLSATRWRLDRVTGVEQLLNMPAIGRAHAPGPDPQ